jgi:tetratricopeptide (TPR) repeat protein
MVSRSSIVSLNTMAITLMQKNNHDEAIESLRRALTCLQDLPKNNGSKPLTPHANETLQCHHSYKKVFKSISIQRQVGNTTVNFWSTSPHNCFEFYNHAFDISSNITTEMRGISESIMPTVLLYNMGLAYHGKAVRSGSSSEFHQALKFYQMSLHVLQDNPALHYQDMLHILCLALLNNMGYIHSHFYEWSEMKQCHIILESRLVSTFKHSKDLAEENVFFSYIILSYNTTLMSPAA